MLTSVTLFVHYHYMCTATFNFYHLMDMMLLVVISNLKLNECKALNWEREVLDHRSLYN